MATVMHRSSSDGGLSSGWSEAAAAVAAAAGEEERAGWEVRPGGMVVQARDREDGGAAGVPPRPPPPEIRVRVKHGAARHEVAVSSIATFGVYEEWKDCQKQVNNFSGNSYQDYESREVAEEKWRRHGRKKWRNFLVITTLLLFMVGYVFYFI